MSGLIKIDTTHFVAIHHGSWLSCSFQIHGKPKLQSEDLLDENTSRTLVTYVPVRIDIFVFMYVIIPYFKDTLQLRVY